MAGFGYLEGTCPHCGERTRERCNAFAYGSPIRFCERCKQEYLDRRFREVAISGLDAKSTSAVYYIKCFVILLAMTAIAGGWLYFTIHYKGYYHTLAVALVIVGAIGTIGSLVLALWVKLGFAKKSNDRYLEESKRRLRNPAYAAKLQEYGYVIPAEYQAQGVDAERKDG